MLSKKGLSTREIGERLGWDHSTIVKDLSGEKSPKSGEKSSRPSTTGGRKEARAAIAKADR
jgi:hypothetical protein